jgi:predicted transposase/invertase (TIGR01784 family)
MRRSKGSVYDLLCRTDDGSKVIVELQRRKQDSYAERMLYYSMHQILKQVESGESSFDFCPVYVISILNFTIEQNSGIPDVKTVYRLYEESTHSLLTDRLTFIFLELSKFRKSKEELSGDILEGMYFCFKNMSSLQERPDALNHDIFRKIFEVSELLNMDAETRSKVIEKMTTERDLRNQMAYARKEAIEEGMAEGRAIGLEQGLAEGSRTKAEEIAKNLKAKGMSDEEIASIVGLDIEIVSSL